MLISTTTSSRPKNSHTTLNWGKGDVVLWYKPGSCNTMILTIRQVFQLNMSSIVGIGEAEHLRTHVLTECLKTRREKYAVPPDVALERHTKRVIPGFWPVRSLLDTVGLSLLSATNLASRYGIEGGICRPLNHMRQIPCLLTAPNRPCHYNLT